MGTPIDKSPCGVLCPLCWGSGKTFGDVCTPRNVTLTLSGIEKTPSWIPANGEQFNGDIELANTDSIPCTYRATTSKGRFVVVFIGSGTYVTAFSNTGIVTFRSVELRCQLWGVSNLNPSAARFFNGDCLIFLGLR